MIGVEPQAGTSSSGLGGSGSGPSAAAAALQPAMSCCSQTPSPAVETTCWLRKLFTLDSESRQATSGSGRQGDIVPKRLCVPQAE
eukprot:2872026-Rhodomonas_salina.1